MTGACYIRLGNMLHDTSEVLHVPNMPRPLTFNSATRHASALAIIGRKLRLWRSGAAQSESPRLVTSPAWETRNAGDAANQTRGSLTRASCLERSERGAARQHGLTGIHLIPLSEAEDRLKHADRSGEEPDIIVITPIK